MCFLHCVYFRSQGAFWRIWMACQKSSSWAEVEVSCGLTEPDLTATKRILPILESVHLRTLVSGLRRVLSWFAAALSLLSSALPLAASSHSQGTAFGASFHFEALRRCVLHSRLTLAENYDPSPIQQSSLDTCSGYLPFPLACCRWRWWLLHRSPAIP